MTAAGPAEQPRAQLRVAVCVVTFRRPEGLARLLAALGQLVLPRDVEVEIIVVDNDPEQPVADRVSRAAAALPLPIRYVQEVRPGVSFARNTALAEARESDLVAFIDDDMTPHRDWLSALVRAQQSSDATAVAGPVRPDFACPPPRWLAEVFALCYARPMPGRAPTASAGNLLLERPAIHALGLGFAGEFSRLGGEDTQLMSDLTAAGLKIAWASDAVVTEHIPAARMSVGWLARRWFRYGVIDARVELRRRPGISGHARALGRGALRVGAGGLLMVPAATAALWCGAAAPMRRVYTIARGLGMIAGTLGWQPRAYGA